MARVEPVETPAVNPSLTHDPDAPTTSTVSVEAASPASRLAPRSGATSPSPRERICYFLFPTR